VKSRGSQCNETLLVRAAVRPGKKLGLQSAAKNLQMDEMEGELRISKGRVFQTVGAATAKLWEPKHVRTRGTDSKLESDERKRTRQTRPALTPAMQAGTRFIYPGGMEGW